MPTIEELNQERLRTLKMAIDALAEKYNVTRGRVEQIIAESVSPPELKELDFKDLDAIVQEGLVTVGGRRYDLRTN